MEPTPIRPLTRDEVRAIDTRAANEFALPTIVLMENAGRGAANWLRERAGEKRRVRILCGPGNNGGDGGVVARFLDAWGYDVKIAWLVDPAKLRGDAATQWAILDRSGIDQVAWHDVDDLVPRLTTFLAEADWVVDALLGTGLTRVVEGSLRTAIEAINACGRPVLSLDLPSGLDADSGQPLGLAVRATITATFVALKVGFLAPESKKFTGEVRVVDIGLPRKILEAFGS